LTARISCTGRGGRARGNLGGVTAALRSAPGVVVHLELERNGKPERVTMRLKRML
jgi:hypothetical protein